MDLPRATRLPLHLSVNVTDDWLEAIEFGAVVDGRPPAQLVELTPEVRFVLRAPRGPVSGFTVHGYQDLDVDALGDAGFGGPRFKVPLLGLDDASLGEVILAARGRFEVSTADVCFFSLALACAEEDGDLEAAAGHWLSCVEAGDMRGMFGLGYTLFDLDRPVEAYTHLRRYSELAGHNSWAWLWLGRTCEALGELEEAATAYRAAVKREREGSFRTDAAERLRDLERRTALRQSG
ncbi:MAG: Anaphase-promoting complex, cyclosome, subunit 3 [Solirubrobacteraceae bacterium]|jgi:tetratricopeptide (TPR) repeat protein|nr:Anaphase-promoting complex, cyclosome, subunit 3 [Solirubrobacteraceae bacterium]